MMWSNKLKSINRDQFYIIINYSFNFQLSGIELKLLQSFFNWINQCINVLTTTIQKSFNTAWKWKVISSLRHLHLILFQRRFFLQTHSLLAFIRRFAFFVEIILQLHTRFTVWKNFEHLLWFLLKKKRKRNVWEFNSRRNKWISYWKHPQRVTSWRASSFNGILNLWDLWTSFVSCDILIHCLIKRTNVKQTRQVKDTRGNLQKLARKQQRSQISKTFHV